jgi:hypothetical protein
MTFPTRGDALRCRPYVRARRRDQRALFPHTVKRAMLDLPRAEGDDRLARFRRVAKQRGQRPPRARRPAAPCRRAERRERCRIERQGAILRAVRAACKYRLSTGASAGGLQRIDLVRRSSAGRAQDRREAVRRALRAQHRRVQPAIDKRQRPRWTRRGLPRKTRFPARRHCPDRRAHKRSRCGCGLRKARIGALSSNAIERQPVRSATRRAPLDHRTRCGRRSTKSGSV